MKFVVRPYGKGEEAYVAEAHKRIYEEEYGWGPAFTDYAMRIALQFPNREHTDKEGLWVAEAEGKLIGCIMLCQAEEPQTGQLRLFLVEKNYRRYGVGTALLTALMKQVQAVGYTRLILWTASPLADAIKQYEKLGFHCAEEVVNTDWNPGGEPIYEIKMVKELFA